LIKNNVIDTIKKNDLSIKHREDKLISTINDTYSKACKKALKKFKVLIGSKETSITKDIAKVLDETIEAFSSEFNKLVNPITMTTQESYDEGLKETGQLIKMLADSETTEFTKSRTIGARDKQKRKKEVFKKWIQ
jgi:hypothetical protein